VLTPHEAVELLEGLRAIQAGARETAEIEPDTTLYLTPAAAAELAGVTTQRLHAMRRRGELRSIGLTASEYKRARELAGWGDSSGWAPRVFFLRADVEALARQEAA
jgi:hypothetical protein